MPHSPIPSSLSESRERVGQAQLGETYGKLPLSFEENQGQVDGKVNFLSRGSGYTLFLTPTEAVLALSAQSPETQARHDVKPGRRQPPRTRSTVLRMKLVGANPSPQAAGLEELPGKSNYFIGGDSSKWRTNVATYAKVKYLEVYPGIDLIYYGNQTKLEYDWIVSPGANPGAIKFAVEGTKKIKVDSKGDLVLVVAGGEVRLHKPVIYQETDGVRHEIAGGYVSGSNREVTFAIADYDRARPLVIDPVLFYSTYLGGSSFDSGEGIAVDSSGNAYIVGFTASTNFPTANPLQPARAGGSYEAFVTKFNPSGSALVYSTYLGGSGDDVGRGIAVDSSGSAYVTGSTSSTNFPTVNPRQILYAGGVYDAFVTKFDPSGSALVYSTYHGGNGGDEGLGIAVDSSGSSYLTGSTDSTNFPTVNPRQILYAGGVYDAFVTKFDPSGSALVYSTYHGGSATDFAFGIAVDSSGSSYLTGSTDSTNFPTANARQPAYAGGFYDAFVTKFNPSGSALVYSTYLGGSSQDQAWDIAVDSSGNAYIVGFTASTNFPTANPLQPAIVGSYDAFVTKFNPSGSALVYSTYHGGNGYDDGSGIAVDSSGNAYLTGRTFTTNYGGFYDIFVTKVSPSGNTLVYSNYHGGNGDEEVHGIAVDSSGNVYVTGRTSSTNFLAANPLQPFYGGNTDAFILKIGELTTISVSPATVAPGGSVTATWVEIPNPTSNDWIGLYASPGADNLTQLSYLYTNGQASSNLPFTVPAGTPPGTTYELRLFSDNSFTRLATSNSFTVLATTTLNVSPTTVSSGGSVTATWANIANPTASDWIGLYASSEAGNLAYLSYIYTNGQGSSNLPFNIPQSVAPGATYELRLFRNNGFTRLATSNSFTVQAATTLGVVPATVSPGGSVTATWANIPSPTINDWIGLYASSGAGNFAQLSYLYTNGQASSNLPFTVPGGTPVGTTYELRLFSNNSFTRLATSNSFTVLAAMTLNVSPTTVSPGGSVTATWANIPSPTANDWLGLYASPGAGNFSYLSYRYTNGQTSSNLPFTVPSGTPAGTTYELRLFSNNSFTRLATSNSFTVQVLATTLSVVPTTVYPGGSVTATWANIASPTANDWIALYASSGAVNTAYLSYRYTNGLASSNLPFIIPGGAAPGATYELRLFSNGGYTRLATSNSFTVQVTTLSVSPTTVAPGGSVTATWANITNPTATDWMALYATSGAANTAFLSYRYTNGQAGSNLPFTIPGGAAPGTTYELRLFSNNTYTRLATSNTFIVQ